MITKLEAENFKRIKAIRIEPDGSPLVVIGGRNGQGKTSTLDAIEAALGGGKRAPAEPITKGQKKSRIVVETETLTVTRSFTAKGSRLEVKPKAEGAVPMTSPQKVLDELVGALSFDPLEFGRMDPTKQSRVLRDLVGLDLAAMDDQRKAYETERRDVGRDRKKAEGALAKMPEPTGDAIDELSVADILAEIKAREERNDDRNSQRARLAAMRADAQESVDELKATRAAIDQAQKTLDAERNREKELAASIEEIRAEGKQLAAEVEQLPPDESVDDLKAKLADAENVAQRSAELARRAELEGEFLGLGKKYDDLTAKIEQVDDTRDKAVAEAKYPIVGLEAHDDGVYLDGVPWDQASGAEALRASVAIGLALNPELKILLIRDASLLDADSLAAVRDQAAEAGAQLWLERVGGGDEVSVVIEDGEVLK